MSSVKVAMDRSGTAKGMLTTGIDAAVTAGAALGGNGCKLSGEWLSHRQLNQHGTSFAAKSLTALTLCVGR